VGRNQTGRVSSYAGSQLDATWTALPHDVGHDVAVGLQRVGQRVVQEALVQGEPCGGPGARRLLHLGLALLWLSHGYSGSRNTTWRQPVCPYVTNLTHNPRGSGSDKQQTTFRKHRLRMVPCGTNLTPPGVAATLPSGRRDRSYPSA
jgi:hypothetical protein